MDLVALLRAARLGRRDAAVGLPLQFVPFRALRSPGYLKELEVEEAIPHTGESHGSRMMSAHGSEHLVMWREDGEIGWESRPILWSKGTTYGIQDLDEMKTSGKRNSIF